MADNLTLTLPCEERFEAAHPSDWNPEDQMNTANGQYYMAADPPYDFDDYIAMPEASENGQYLPDGVVEPQNGEYTQPVAQDTPEMNTSDDSFPIDPALLQDKDMSHSPVRNSEAPVESVDTVRTPEVCVSTKLQRRQTKD